METAKVPTNHQRAGSQGNRCRAGGRLPRIEAGRWWQTPLNDFDPQRIRG